MYLWQKAVLQKLMRLYCSLLSSGDNLNLIPTNWLLDGISNYLWLLGVISYNPSLTVIRYKRLLFLGDISSEEENSPSSIDVRFTEVERSSSFSDFATVLPFCFICDPQLNPADATVSSSELKQLPADWECCWKKLPLLSVADVKGYRDVRALVRQTGVQSNWLKNGVVALRCLLLLTPPLNKKHVLFVKGWKWLV